MKRIHQFVITGGGIVIAACFIDSFAVGSVAVLAAMGVLILGGLLARLGPKALPKNPARARVAIEASSIAYDTIAAVIAAVAFWGAAKLPSVLPGGAKTPKQVLAVAAAVLVVELTKIVAVDADLVDQWVGGQFKGAFQASYQQQLTPEGPLPNPVGGAPPADPWLNVFQESRYSGWNFGSRRQRARALQGWIDEQHPTFRTEP
jgi:hypothetical protein